MADTRVVTGRKVYSNLKALKFTPYTDESTIGADSFIFEDGLADSFSVQRGDNTVNSRDNEMKDEPLLENTILGKWDFAFTVIDMQGLILTKMCGWDEDAATKSYLAPNAYKPLWVMVEATFNSNDDKVVMTKVKLNPKEIWASLKTSSGQIDFTGTGYANDVKVGTKTGVTPIVVTTATQAVQVGSQITGG